ncbi:RNA polymerase sigma-70 factor (ECF subfamily) [Sphingomonas sp. BE270]|uniref:RNA polymerase sigma factor n=2 Tax=Pseudomonadota TaxID=1224 RepID=A0A7Y7USI3_9SPHN|nr:MULTISPECIES: RNA polymerase sigma factor [Sphingomonas]MBZ6384056.1 RNA polymerase sigma factor [Sphingomonas sanguinis]MDR7260480.1 RNA polymerase sigma-70 factor (ECF subfamily) [Sphingomonas sp. BE270]NNG51376.1 RNA polymerase sigma factor [Sphingomonas sanguinis]NNG51841.1 RNA polymerase sigma factor [Sphingomonas sanguinis]NVP33347.1 RNA polymerase sigma factor [Sphingomonas sanguinis]
MPIIRPIDRWFVDEVMPHEASYLAFARRLTGSREDASDLVQEAYLRLFAADGWAGIVNPQAYVHRSIRHIVIDRLRRAKIVDFRQFVEADHVQLHDDVPDQFRVAAGKEALKRFSEVLSRLPDRCREVFVRRRVQEQSPAEIAEDLGVSVSTLEKRLARAIYLLTQEGVGSPSNDPDDGSELPDDIAWRG